MSMPYLTPDQEVEAFVKRCSELSQSWGGPELTSDYPQFSLDSVKVMFRIGRTYGRMLEISNHVFPHLPQRDQDEELRRLETSHNHTELLAGALVRFGQGGPTPEQEQRMRDNYNEFVTRVTRQLLYEYSRFQQANGGAS